MLKNNKAVSFLFTAAGLYLFWLLLYYLFVKPYTSLDYYLNYSIVEIGVWVFDLFGQNAVLEIESDHVILLLDQGNGRGIWVGDECNGFKLFSVFIIFILAFPSKWKHKLLYIPIGLIIIHLANVLRVVALVLINNHYPRYLDFNHLYTFTIFVYGIIFLLWFFYAKKYRLDATAKQK